MQETALKLKSSTFLNTSLMKNTTENYSYIAKLSAMFLIVVLLGTQGIKASAER